MKKLLSLLLCLLIVFGCLPVSAFAADGAAVKSDSIEFETAADPQLRSETFRPSSFKNGFFFSDTAADAQTVAVSFLPNGGADLDSISVTVGGKYGNLPSSSVAGLSGGSGNWYLVDADGQVTDTNITKRSTVTSAEAHTLFIKRKVLAPTLSLKLTVPNGISDSYGYYIPDDSTRVLTVTVNNRNDEILNYTYEWFQGDTLLQNETAATLTLAGNVSDTATYTVRVTATLKENSGIIVTESSASAEASQKVTIRHASNTLYYDANGGKEGPSSNFTGGTTITVSSSEPTRDGYLFNGWNTAANGTGIAYSGGDQYLFTGDNGNGGCAVTLYAQWIKTYPIFVGGIQVTEKNASNIFGDGTAYYEASSNTLTLNNATITGGYEIADGYWSGISADTGLCILLVGENSVTGPNARFTSCGLWIDGDLYIGGTGSLTVRAGTAINSLAAHEYKDDYAQSIAIVAYGSVRIENVTLNAYGNRAAVEAIATPDDTWDGYCFSYSMGICVMDGDLEITSLANVNAYGADALAIRSFSFGIAVYESDDGRFDGDFTIGGNANVVAVGGRSDVSGITTETKWIHKAQSYGVMSDGVLRIDEGASLEATGKEAIGEYAFSTGVYACSDIDVFWGYLNAASGLASGIGNASSAGITMSNGGFYVYDNMSQVRIESYRAESSGSAYANGIYVYNGDIGIYGGSVTVKGGTFQGKIGDCIALYIEAFADDDGDLTGGCLTVASETITLHSYGYGFAGAELKVVAQDDIAIYTTCGIFIESEMAVTAPENAFLTFAHPRDSSDYYTVTDANGIGAKEVTVELLTYKVRILDAKSVKAVLIPAGWSINQAYCEFFGIEDFSEGLNTEKDGFRFVGFYTDEACTEGNEYSFDTEMNQDAEVYLKWVPLYSFTILPSEDGELSLSEESAAAGDSVTFTVLPNMGMTVVSVTVTDADGNTISVTANGDGTYSFTQPNAAITVQATYQKEGASVTPDATEATTETTVSATADPSDSQNSADKKGCAGTVLGCNAILLLTFGAAVVLKKKKED